MVHPGRRLMDSGSVIDQSQLPSPSGSYQSDHLSITDSTLAIRTETSRRVKIHEF